MGLALAGRALLSKFLIILSADWWSCTPYMVVFWLVATPPPAPGSMGSMAGLMVNSKRVYAKGDLSVPPIPVVSPC